MECGLGRVLRPSLRTWIAMASRRRTDYDVNLVDDRRPLP